MEAEPQIITTLRKLGMHTKPNTAANRTCIQMTVYLLQELFGFDLGIDDYRWFYTEGTT